jgi:hypothetical protein
MTALLILSSKPDKTIYTAPTASVFDAVKLIINRTSVLIMLKTVVRLITKRDYARKIVLMAGLPKNRYEPS